MEEGTKRTGKDVKPGGPRDVYELPGQIDSRFVLAMHDAIMDKLEEKGEWRSSELSKERLHQKALTHLLDGWMDPFDREVFKKSHLIDAANYLMMLWYVLEKEGGG